MLHSNLSYEVQDEVMHTPSPDVFRIILSTNIAESSITIPYIEYGTYESGSYLDFLMH